MDVFVSQLNSIGRAFVSFALPMLIQSSLLILVLLALNLLFRRKTRAVFRYWLLLLILIKLVLPTTFSSPTSLGYWVSGDFLALDLTATGPDQVQLIPDQPVLGPAPAEYPTAAAPPVQTNPQPIVQPPVQPVVTPTPQPIMTPAAPISAAVAITWPAVVFLAWLAAALALVMLLVQRLFFVCGLVRQATHASFELSAILTRCADWMSVRTRVRLKLSPNATSPAVCGLFRPTILLPVDLPSQLDNHHLRAVLFHELAHIKRRDLWLNLAQTLLQIVYFYNPLLWLANALIRHLREQAVDEMVLVAMGENHADYPDTLLAVAKLSLARPALSLRLIGVVESKKALTARIKHIITRPLPKSARLGLLGLVGLIVTAAVLLPMAKADTKPEPFFKELGPELLTAIKQGNADQIEHLLKGRHPISGNPRFDNMVDLLADLHNSYDLSETKLDSILLEDGDHRTNRVSEAKLFYAPMKSKTGQEEAIIVGFVHFGGRWHASSSRGNVDSVARIRTSLLSQPLPGHHFREVFSAAESAYTATLPNGIVVELVGVCNHPNTAHQWWRPDGSKLDENLYQEVHGGVRPGEDERAYEFTICLNNLPQERIGCAWQFEPSDSWVGSSGFVSGKDVENLRVTAVVRPKDADHIAVKFGIAAGPWSVLSESSGAGASAGSRSKEVYSFSPAFQQGGDTVITIAHNVVNQQIRVIAITKAGEQYTSRDTKTAGAGDMSQITARFRGMDLKDVKLFQLQTRPYEWVEFRNVSLVPGKKTAVQVVDPSQLANESLAAPVILVSADEQKGQYHWRVLRRKPSRVVRGWYSIEGGVGPTAHLGGGATTLKVGPRDILFDFKRDNDFLLLGYRDAESVYAATFPDGGSKSSWPTGAVLKTVYLKESATLSDTYYTHLWRGDFIKDGHVIKSVIYAARLAGEGEEFRGFLGQEEPVRKFHSLPQVESSPATQTFPPVMHYTFDTDEGLEILHSNGGMDVTVQDGQLRTWGKTTDTEWGNDGARVPITDLGGSLDASVDFKLPTRQGYGLVYLDLQAPEPTGPPMILYQWHVQKKLWLVRPATVKGWYQVHTMWLKCKWSLAHGRYNRPDVGKEDTDFVNMRMFVHPDRRHIDYYVDNVLLDTLILAEPLARVENLLLAFQSPRRGHEYDVRFDNLKIASTAPTEAVAAQPSTMYGLFSLLEPDDSFREKSTDLTIGWTGEKVSIPGPAVFPEWIKQTAEWQSWRRTKNVRTFTTHDPQGRKLVISALGWENSNPPQPNFSSMQVYRPDGSKLAQASYSVGTTPTQWSEFDASGQELLRVMLAPQQRLSSVSFLDADGARRKWGVNDQGIVHIEQLNTGAGDIVTHKIPTAPSAEPLTFGPVIERVVNDDNEKKHIYIDFDTGKLFTPPDDLRSVDEKAVKEWMARNRIDAMGEIDSRRGLTCYDMVAMGFSDEIVEKIMSNSTMSPRDRTQFTFALLADESFGGSIFDKEGKVKLFVKTGMYSNGEFPTSFVFWTREGGMGILQIVGFTENPKGIKIRYKMVQQGRSQAWSEKDIALKKAMNRDLSFGVGQGRTQAGAIQAWEEFLNLEGISDEQKLFATWRIASLYAYNFDPVEREEKPNMDRAEKLFREVRDLIPGLVSLETINAATQHASMWGSPIERAMRKAENYRWLLTRSQEMLANSAARVSRHGYIVGEKFYGQTLNPPRASLQERHQLLEHLLKDGQENIVKQITEFIEWSQDKQAVDALLASVADTAAPEHLEQWRNTRGRVESGVSQTGSQQNELLFREIQRTHSVVAAQTPYAKLSLLQKISGGPIEGSVTNRLQWILAGRDVARASNWHKADTNRPELVQESLSIGMVTLDYHKQADMADVIGSNKPRITALRHSSLAPLSVHDLIKRCELKGLTVNDKTLEVRLLDRHETPAYSRDIIATFEISKPHRLLKLLFQSSQQDRVVWHYSNYREIADGLWFPQQIQSRGESPRGTITSDIALEKIEFPGTIPDSEFDIEISRATLRTPIAGQERRYIKKSERFGVEYLRGLAQPDEADEQPWGEPVEGVQVRLRVDKLKWKASETPTFSLDIRNVGGESIEFVRVAQAHCQIELDGRWYGWAENLSVHTRVQFCGPGEQDRDAIIVELNDKWGLPRVGNDLTGLPGAETYWGKRLKLTPGKHKVRVRFRRHTRLPPDQLQKQATSNPVQIEILPNDSGVVE